MESAPSLETVLNALQALYRNPDIAGKEKASVWLGEMQRSVFAWQIADQLLQINQDVESCYFAAQTMKIKIQYAFHELPATAHMSLRDSLLNHAAKVGPATPPVIVTQLCLALADLALQMATWKHATTEIIQKFGTNSQHLFFLLEVLTVLPEEISSRSLRLGANRRNEVTEEMMQAAPLVLNLLTSCLTQYPDPGQQPTSEIQFRPHVRIYRCLSSWFNIGAIPQEHIVNSPLLTAPFQALCNPKCSSEVHEAATDCICSALYISENLAKYRLLAQALFQGVQTLPDAYHVSVAEEDIDKSLNYCRIFTEMAESFLDSITTTPGQDFGDFRTIELVLTCIGHHQYEVAEITFNFWYRLSEILFNKNEEAKNILFKPYIERLMVALCRHCQVDPDHEGLLDESDDFFDFRLRVSELIKDIVFLIGSSSCFAQMFQHLQAQSSSTTWDSSEAALYIMAAVAKNLLPDEGEIVPQVLQAVLNLPQDAHVAVRYTSTFLVGELSEWINLHPNYLEPVLQFLLSGLQNVQLSTIAAKSLQNVCSQCKEKMTEHFPGLLHIIQSMETFNLSHEAAVGLLMGTSVILAKMPHEKITEGFRQLCAVQITPLSKLIESGPNNEIKKGNTSDPIIWIDRLAVIFRHSSPIIVNGQQHPCQPVIQELWPVLSNACAKYQSDIRIIERCCRCIRFAVRCLGKHSSGLLHPLVTQMVNLYQNHQHSCYLYLGSILVDEYGREAGCISGLLDMLQAFCGPTFKILEEANGLRNHPDTVDDLFRLCTRFTQRAPLPFLQHTMMKPILCCAIAACSLDHRDANASVMKFLSELIRIAHQDDDGADAETKRTIVMSLISEHGQALTQSILNATVFCLPSYMVTDVAEVVQELMVVDRPVFCKWLEVALKTMPTESHGGAVNATHKQLTDFHKACTSAEDLPMVSRALKDFCRLFR
ncbi:unnamed protein product [Owenia fusiformis]|uniref:Transportin-3 n=1 Tax=Owenia fusiformis TaxID=6347 RepID=A0A8S4PZQ4_OWEFU|nr:unnamed protein product [Owenia fusiformis]